MRVPKNLCYNTGLHRYAWKLKGPSTIKGIGKRNDQEMEPGVRGRKTIKF
jgi:hypothetical protein